MNKSKEFYLYILYSVFIYIRGLDDTNLSQARSLAYIFHNVPGILRVNFNEKEAEKAWKIIQERAEYFKLSSLIDGWEKSTFDILADEMNQE